MVAKKCDECGGARYFRETDGRYRPCECVKRSLAARAWRIAGIPARHDAETWKTFRARFILPTTLSFAVRALGSPHNPGGELVLRGDPEGRELAASLLARTAVDRGLLARFVDVPGLIERAFLRDEAQGPDPEKVDLVVLRVGGEPRHAYNRSVVERLVRARHDSSVATVVVGDDPVRDVRDFGAYETADALDGVGDRFASVSITRRIP